MIWDENEKDNFVQVLSSETTKSSLDEMDRFTKNVIPNENTVNQAVTLLVDALRNAADPLFLKSMNTLKSTGCQGRQMQDPGVQAMKKLFYKANDRDRAHPGDSNREIMLTARSEYKSAAWKSKHKYEVAQTSKLLNAKLNNVKMYWKLLSSCGEQSVRTNLTNDEFYQYFENISNPCDEFYSVDPDIKESLNNIIHSDLQEIIKELDVPINRNEVYKAVKELKMGKSGGDNLLINELFVHGKDILVPYLTKLFNYSFESGIFPSAWTEGLLVPLHKIGSCNNAENSRGITLLSVLGKLYTRVLNIVCLYSRI